MTTLFLSAATDAVDVSLVTKRDAVLRFSQRESLDLGCIAAIGDSENDLPFLEIEGLGLVGVPSNAQPHVRTRVQHLNNSVLLRGEVLEGFIEFYEIAASKGIRHIISDRDGVLIWKSQTEKDIAALRGLLLKAAPPTRPSISILTGSSVVQNMQFIADYNLGDSSFCSDWVRAHPEIIWSENGSLFINVLTGHTREAVHISAKQAIEKLKGPFETEALKRIEAEVLPEFGFKYSYNYCEQTDKVYIPPKKTMVTLNIPKSTRSEKDYRRTQDSNRFRERLLDILKEVASSHGFIVQGV
ncbi:hypothetical protein RPD76_03385 [Methylomonas sp. MV1]|uniref:hypothetical protein n=1 Tax=Methylomonas sp. MV1 TaxID=3073620 RepID=UPI0028A3E4EA|nr:hypothetical protein [Methylomonas sp. MV1]MDT4328931.1 hypothetical protein [Methylomonas sp. MV1]